MYIKQLCVFREFSYLGPQACIFFPDTKGAFPLVPAAGLFCLFLVVSPKLPGTCKISLGFAFQIADAFFFFKCDCGKSESLKQLYRSGMDNFTPFLCKIFLPHSVFAQIPPPPFSPSQLPK